jgi:hypothetical protein
MEHRVLLEAPPAKNETSKGCALLQGLKGLGRIHERCDQDPFDAHAWCGNLEPIPHGQRRSDAENGVHGSKRPACHTLDAPRSRGCHEPVPVQSVIPLQGHGDIQDLVQPPIEEDTPGEQRRRGEVPDRRAMFRRVEAQGQKVIDWFQPGHAESAYSHGHRAVNESGYVDSEECVPVIEVPVKLHCGSVAVAHDPFEVEVVPVVVPIWQRALPAGAPNALYGPQRSRDIAAAHQNIDVRESP